jgi:hypothetical protein
MASLTGIRPSGRRCEVGPTWPSIHGSIRAARHRVDLNHRTAHSQDTDDALIAHCSSNPWLTRDGHGFVYAVSLLAVLTDQLENVTPLAPVG